MLVRILGSAAGGGFPQWNCGCPGCEAVRNGSRPARPRTQSSIAVSPDGRGWFLLNASPDLRVQIEAWPALQPRGLRDSPIQAVLLTDAELDHTLGLLLLREGSGLRLRATPGVRRTLCDGTALLRTLAACCHVDWQPVVPGVEAPLGDRLTYRAFGVPTEKPSRFGAAEEDDSVVGYRLTDTQTGRVLVYLPGVQAITEAVRRELEQADCLLVDGTCWRDDELIQLGASGKTAHDMGHLAIAGPGGSLEQLAPLPIERKLYIHINNTNPILLDDSPERRIVETCGLEVATDGLEMEI